MAIAFICRRKPEIMTVRLDTDYPNFNPYYLDDAKGLTAGSSQFDDFFGHKPVLMSNTGGFYGDLNPTDFTKYKSGTSAPVTTVGNDTMIYFPRRGLRIYKEDEYIYVSVTKAYTRQSVGLDDTWSGGWRAFNYNGIMNDGICVGAYQGYVTNNKLYSSPNKTPTNSLALGTVRTYAHNRGSGYEQLSFYVLTYLQVLYTIKYQAQNSQTTIGRGCTDTTAPNTTGTTQTKGMDWGSTDGTQSVKIFGIEDFFGGLQTLVDGAIYNSSRILYTGTYNFNDTGSNYTTTNSYAYTANYDGFPNNITGTNQGGFTPYGTFSDSQQRYFYDKMMVYPNCIPCHGGKFDGADWAGVYMFRADKSATSAGTGMGSRLVYMTVGND